MRVTNAAMMFVHHRTRLGLGLRREVLADVELADRIAQGGAGDDHAALPAWQELLAAVEGLAVEGEPLVHERLRQHRQALVDRVEAEEVFPGCRSEPTPTSAALSDHRARLPDDEAVLVREPGGGEEGVPVEAWCALGELAAFPAVVRLFDADRLLAGRVHPGDGLLERQDGRHVVLAVGEPRELEDAPHVRGVFFADGRHRGGIADVVLAVRHTQAALEQVADVTRGLVEVLRHEKTEDVLGVEVGRVERVHVRPQGASQHRCQAAAIGDGVDLIQHRPNRRQAVLLDSRLVHERGVVPRSLCDVGDGAALGVSLEQRPETLARQLVRYLPGPPRRLVRGDVGAAEPGAVRISEEVVAWLDAAIHPRRVDIRRARHDTAALALGPCCRRASAANYNGRDRNRHPEAGPPPQAHPRHLIADRHSAILSTTDRGEATARDQGTPSSAPGGTATRRR